MRRTLTALAAPLLLLGLAACGPTEAPEEETEVPTTEQPTETSPPVEVSDGGGDDDEVVQPTETTEYSEKGDSESR